MMWGFAGGRETFGDVLTFVHRAARWTWDEIARDHEMESVLSPQTLSTVVF